MAPFLLCLNQQSESGDEILALCRLQRGQCRGRSHVSPARPVDRPLALEATHTWPYIGAVVSLFQKKIVSQLVAVRNAMPFKGRFFTTFAFVAASLIALPATLIAQSTGTISGFVRDPSGAALPGSRVTAVYAEQQVQRTAETNGEGFYTFNGLPPGEYSVTAEKENVQRLVRSGVVLTVNQNLRVDLALQLGQVTQAVTITGEAPLVDTRSGAISGLVDDRRVVDLPLNGRDVITLASTIPGIVSVNAPQQLTDARSGPTMNVNGSLENQNMFTFNGGIFVNPSRQTAMNYPPPDAIQEFSIQTQNFSAEFGRNAGSQVNVVSKSGTNEFHGAAWEFLRNDDLNARNFFASRVPAHKQNQYGAAAGAPIVRNKLFIFGSYQGTQNHQEAVSNQITVPSAAERSGDFTQLGKSLQNPVNPVTGQPYTDGTGAPCVQDNVIRTSCVSPMAKNLLPLIPQSPSGKVTVLSPQPMNDNMYLVRTDWNQSAKILFPPTSL